MAAGLGFKEFTTGDVLTAANANGYLASQVVMVFASAAARTSAIASPQEGMISYLKDTNATEYYTGAAWSNIAPSGGGMTQLGSTTTLSGASTTVSFTATGYQNIQIVVTGLTTTNNDYPRMDINATASTTSLAGVQGSTTFTGTELYMLAGANESKNTSANNSWVVNVYDVTSTTTFKPVDSRSGGQDYLNNYKPVNQAGQFMSNSAISSVRVTTINGGNSFTGGTIRVYGVK